MEYFVISDTGLQRSNNEDFALTKIYHPNIGLFVVADGMGGGEAGEIASRTAADCVQEYFSKREEQLIAAYRNQQYDEIREMLRASFAFANETIFEQTQRFEDRLYMGSTLVGLLLLKERLMICSVGDSRAYMLHRNGLRQITKDHSYVQELLDKGVINKEDPAFRLQKNLITRAIGIDHIVETDFFELEWDADDQVLLCTDGLTNMVDDEEIERVLISYGTVREAMEYLMKIALENGGRDNITLIGIKNTSHDSERNEI